MCMELREPIPESTENSLGPANKINGKLSRFRIRSIILCTYRFETMELEMTTTEDGSSWICVWAINIANKDLKREAEKIRDLELTLYEKEMLLTTQQC